MLSKNALYIVALPIGNHYDISNRAIDCLSQVDCVAAEDTRKIKSLAQLLRINLKQVIAHHNHNETESLDGVLALLSSGKSVALVSDAGTPNICDPGFRLVKACMDKNIPVIPLPGASSLTACLSVCPLGGTDHYFYGFLPSKQKDRLKTLESFYQLVGLSSKVVFFESPHRFEETMKDIMEVWQDRPLFIAREITKEFESFYYGSAQEIIQSMPKVEKKGEFVICIDTSKLPEKQKSPSTNIEEDIKKQLEEGLKPKQIQKNLSQKSSLSSKELYSLITTIKQKHN